MSNDKKLKVPYRSKLYLNIQIFLALICVTVLAANGMADARYSQESAKKPNIVFLLTDDLGYGELGAYGQKQIKTPFLDQLASEGMKFTNAYAGNAICAASRAVLMTGIHSGKSSVRGNTGYIPERQQIDRVWIKSHETTLGEMLKTAGYETIFFGKWHLDDPHNLDTWATSRGFDHAVQGQWPRRKGKIDIDPNIDWVNGLNDAIRYDYTKYNCMDEFRTEQAINYLEKRVDDKPFFLFMSYRVPHAHEINIRNTTMYKDAGWPEIERLHAARISMMDEQVGRLIRYLDVTGELDNTLIIFTSDNGGHSEKGHDKNFFTSNGALRGYKRDLYEGGIRVPYFAIWKDKIKPGKTNSHITSFQDVMPTLAEVAGIITPAQSNGISILPTLLNKKQTTHEYLYWEIHLNLKPVNGNDKGFRQAVRQGKWKAIRYGWKSDTELYDLSKDITESKNIAKKFPEKTHELEALFKASSSDNKHFKYGGNMVKDL